MKKYGYVYLLEYKNYYYVGLRRSAEIDESYFGSGVLWKKIIKNAERSEITRSILGWAQTEEELNNLEIESIKKNQSLFNQGLGGCNIAEGGYNYPFRGKTDEELRLIFNPEYIKKASERQKGKKNTFYGKKHKESTKRKIAENNYRYFSNEENRKKYSKKFSGKNNPMYNRPKTKKMIESVKKANSIPVKIEGEIYSSYSEAEDKTGMSRSTIRRRIRSKNYPDYQLMEEG